MTRAGFIVAVCCCAVIDRAYAVEAGQRSAHEWLGHMNAALAERNYDGILSYFDGDELSTLRVVHAVVDGVQRERLVHLNGAPREVVREGSHVRCIVGPDDDVLELEGSIPSGPFAHTFAAAVNQLASNYDVRLARTDRVANRRAVEIVVAPRDADRYGYRLWVDAETALLLRSELIGANGARLEVFQFVQVDIDAAVDLRDFETATPDGAVTTHVVLGGRGATAGEGASSRWLATWLPDGFAMATWDIRRAPVTEKAVDTSMYSDGLAAFSVFVEEMPLSGGAKLVSRQGATVAVTHVAHGLRNAGFLVTVVGEVPLATAQKIAASIRYAAPAFPATGAVER